jgi:hypothetical protein
VRGGGRKPYRQKGTGRRVRARPGRHSFTRRWRGARPPTAQLRATTPKKMKAAALRGASRPRPQRARPRRSARWSTATLPSPGCSRRCLRSVPATERLWWSLTAQRRRGRACATRRAYTCSPRPAQHLRRPHLRRRRVHRTALDEFVAVRLAASSAREPRPAEDRAAARRSSRRRQVATSAEVAGRRHRTAERPRRRCGSEGERLVSSTHKDLRDVCSRRSSPRRATACSTRTSTRSSSP